jgi:hypothetical protein
MPYEWNGQATQSLDTLNRRAMKIKPVLHKVPKRKYDRFMDKECIPLCDALNAIDGIETVESCCGHNRKDEDFGVHFVVHNWLAIGVLMSIIGDCWMRHEMNICIESFCSENSNSMVLSIGYKSPTGYTAIQRSKMLTKAITEKLYRITKEKP